MNLFELLVLNKLYPGMFSGCLPLLGLLALAGFLVWLSENKGFLIAVGITVVGTIIITALREYLRYKKKTPEELKELKERRKKRNELREWSRRNKC